MTMAPAARKFALASHLVFAVGWIGSVFAYLGLAVAAEVRDDAPTVRSAWIAMELVGWYVIVPLASASLLTGVVVAFGTRWGLLRHYWVLLSLVLTAVGTAVLVMHMPSVSATADIARVADDRTVARLGGDIPHPAIGLLVLLGIQVLNVYKPRGLTRYGRRALSRSHGASAEA